MTSLDELVKRSQGASAPSGSRSLPATPSGLGALVKRSAASPIQPPTSTQKPVPQFLPNQPEVPAKPKEAGLLTRASNFIDRLTARPAEGSARSQSVLGQFPSALAENLVPGLKAIRDDTETAATITGKDLAREVPGAVGAAAQGIAKTVVSPALTAYGAASKTINPLLNLPAAPGVSPTGAVDINIPGLGRTQNLQARADEYFGKKPERELLTPDTFNKIQQGIEVAGFTAEETLNSLFLASLLNIPLQPRQSVVGKLPEKGVIPLEGGESAKVTVSQGPKSFRLYEPPVAAQPLSQQAVSQIQKSGIELKGYDPNLPTYFRLKSNSFGKVQAGEIVQIKPSYFDTFVKSLKGDVGKVPTGEMKQLAEVKSPIGENEGLASNGKVYKKDLDGLSKTFQEGGDALNTTKTFDDLIQKGGVDPTKVYKDPVNKVYTPEMAKQVVSNAKLNMEYHGYPELAKRLDSMIDLNNLTPDSLLNAGRRLIGEAQTGGFVPKAGQTLYRGEDAGAEGGNFYSPSKELAQQYGNKIVQTKLPDKFIDARGQIPPALEEKIQAWGQTISSPEFLSSHKGPIDDSLLWKPAFDEGYNAIILNDHMSGQPNILLNPAYKPNIPALPPPPAAIVPVQPPTLKPPQIVPPIPRVPLPQQTQGVSEAPPQTVPPPVNRAVVRQPPSAGGKIVQPEAGAVDTKITKLGTGNVLVRSGEGNEFIELKNLPPENVARAIQETKRDIDEGRMRKDIEYTRAATEKLALLEELAQTRTARTSLSLRPEKVSQEKTQGAGNTKVAVTQIGGKRVERPTQLVNKSAIRTIVEDSPGKSIVFKIIERDGKMYMSHETATSKLNIRPSALGLVEENLKVGGTISVSAKDLKEPGTGLRVADKDGVTEASLRSDFKDDTVNAAKSADELKQRIIQLNKFGQSKAILRRTGGLSNKTAGVFRYPKAGMPNPKGVNPRGQVHLQDDVVKNDQQYMETLAHELGHGLEYTLTGSTNKDTFRVFGKDLPKEIKDKIREELKANTDKMVGKDRAEAGAGYYYKNTELLARFFENQFRKPGEVAELAPTALEYLEKSAIETPIVQEYLEAVYGTMDKGELKHVFLRDMKQTYQKALGKRVGELAWNDEMRYRAMKERAKILIEKLVKDKFKDVKDSPELLFRAAESIKVTVNDKPVYGTRDFQYAKNDAETAKLLEAGYEPITDEHGDLVTQFEDGKQVARFAKPRYTAEESKRLFESLSPEGKQLVKDFTAAKDEAKDYFNREVIKDVHKINSDLEGWVHHYWDDVPFGIGGDRLKTKIASAKKQRKGAEGYVEDLQKAMTKALTELETGKVYNAFVEDFFARVSMPIAKGQKPNDGWVEVQGDVKRGGIGRPGEMKKTIIEDGKAHQAESVRYQMPAPVYKRFQMIRELAVEAGTVVRVMNSLNRYWRINILFHPGSAATNFISGAIQYSTKILTDFYIEALTGNPQFPKTRKNVYAMITAVTPKGWQDAPDWVYGGDLSNFYGQFGGEKTPGIKLLDKSVDAYADKALKIYGSVERYWKKVIATAEGASSLGGLNEITMEGLRLPTEEEKALLDDINSEIDLFAYDYENVPTWLENYQQNALAQAVKPFVKYPYKYTKQLTTMIEAAFDGTLPWQERVAKLLAVMTIVAAYAAYRERQKRKQKTQEVDADAPAQVSTRGRLYINTDSEGREVFTRVAKYPFLNITEAGEQMIEGNTNTGMQTITDMLGSVSPAGQIALAALGYRNEYQQFTPFPVILGQSAASFIPGTRMLADISKFFDPYQRKQTTFLQGITSLYPTTDAALQEKLHGEARTVRVPVEGDIKKAPGEGVTRTTTDMLVKNYKTDVLLGFLAGLYVKRIDPDVAAAFVTRKDENQQKAKLKAERDALKAKILGN